MKITFLGTGGNGGLPQIDCKCTYCQLAKKNKIKSRLRSSLLLETIKGNIILDCGPDFRIQLHNANLKIQDISVIAISHMHFDHFSGISELAGGKQTKTKVGFSTNNLKEFKSYKQLNFLWKLNYIKLLKESEANKLGINFIPCEHQINIPTDAITVSDNDKKIMYVPDILRLNKNILKSMLDMDLIIFDGTFYNTPKFITTPTHIPIVESAPILTIINDRVIYTHFDHSQNMTTVSNYLKKFKFTCANDMESITL